MPRPFCFVLPYPRFSPAHVLASLEEAIAQVPDARMTNALLEATSPDEQALQVSMEVDSDKQGTLTVRSDGATVALVIEPDRAGYALPWILTIAETMLGNLRDLAAVAAGEVSEDELEDLGDAESAPETFEILKKRARRMFSLDAQAEGAFGVTIAWQKPVGRTQGLLISAHSPRFEDEEASAPTWIALESPVCPKDRLTPEEALRRSRSFDIGALCPRPQHYTLVAKYPLKAMTRATFMTIAMAFAEQADRMESMLTGGKDEY